EFADHQGRPIEALRAPLGHRNAAPQRAERPQTSGASFCLSGAQCRAARALIGLRSRDLAGLAGIAPKTLSDFENGHTSPRSAQRESIQRVLEGLDIVFIANEGDFGEGVRVRRV
ncbi:MAG: helix-turn-helix domain-containing protein, partial [Rhodospirillaceae bacterium]